MQCFQTIVIWGFLGSNLRGAAGRMVTDKSPAGRAWAQHARSPLHSCDDYVNGTYRKLLLCFYIQILLLVTSL